MDPSTASDCNTSVAEGNLAFICSRIPVLVRTTVFTRLAAAMIERVFWWPWVFGHVGTPARS